MDACKILEFFHKRRACYITDSSDLYCYLLAGDSSLFWFFAFFRSASSNALSYSPALSRDIKSSQSSILSSKKPSYCLSLIPITFHFLSYIECFQLCIFYHKHKNFSICIYINRFLSSSFTVL